MSRAEPWVGMLALVALIGCGPIAAPPGATDLREHPEALQERFDSDIGRARLLLLLSPG